MKRYNPKEIEPKWQKAWAESRIYEATEDLSKPKKYILEYFPYPSGAAMHVGHVRNYTIGDALARFNRMAGYNVLHPMGWDGFGLPAENYAIKTGISPRQAIDQNTARFKEQLTQMGFSYDWSREIDSTDPKYYRWTQWFFLLLLKRGLAYQQESLQWWCPHDKTVLANEQVEAGKCWRCGNDVEKKALKQWFFKITDYADRLAKDLDDVDWSDSIKAMQRNWIGRSTGAEITFAVDGHNESISVFTTRPDTLYGATFTVLSPEHPLVDAITTDEQKQAVAAYKKDAQAKSDIERQETNREKTGVFTGSYAKNPISGDKIPIWIADYVLMGYGTGAIMAVPAHDDRDYAFAKKFELKILPVFMPSNGMCMTYIMGQKNISEDDIINVGGVIHSKTDNGHLGVFFPQSSTSLFEKLITDKMEPGYWNEYLGDQTVFLFKHKDGMIERFVLNEDNHDVIRTMGHRFNDQPDSNESIWEWIGGNAFYAQYLLSQREGKVINSGPYNNMQSDVAREKIVQNLAAKGSGKECVNYKIRDWLISRQRYWGAPIPIVHCPKDGAVAVPEDQLPVRLPELKNFEPSGDGRSPLANIPEWVNTDCPTCGGPAERETDTMDGFACSSWYFLRFADPHNDEKAFDADKAKFWLPVDDYIGGAEHAVMHLLYARMWTKVMHDAGLIDFDEPFKTLRNQGMILAPDGQKMSKSKGNTIEPGMLIDQGYGADAIRIMELFLGPWNQAANWSVEGMGGAFRFLQRIWTLVQEYKDDSGSTTSQPAESGDKPTQQLADMALATNLTIKKVTEDLHELSFNTAIAALMELVNSLYKFKTQLPYRSAVKNWDESLSTLLQLLAPFAPHIAEELWQQMDKDGSVHTSQWPQWQEAVIATNRVTIAIQVNGKLRATLELAQPENDQEKIVASAAAHPQVAKYVENNNIRKTVYVPGRLVNFVV